MTDQTAAQAIWTAIAKADQPKLTDLFAADGERVHKLSLSLDLPGGEVLFDWSKTHLDDGLLDQFAALAKAMDFHGKRDALFDGELINNTEGRPVDHAAQRGVGTAEATELASVFHARMRALIEAMDEGVFGDIHHILHIGIGGSALGPDMVMNALGRDEIRYDVAVVSNIDGAALDDVFQSFDPQHTMIAVASKTFTTIETMTNARSALAWLADNGVEDPHGRVIALTAAPDKAVAWGVDETRILPFSESVGGRYSLWSSIGFPFAAALGWDAFEDFLRGAAAMDRHFIEADLTRNAPVLAAFADLLYAQQRGCQTRAVFAYDERLSLVPSYLQQLEMESNGKSVLADGSPLGRPSAPVTWGGVGTDAQHAVFQLLHQGTHLIPVEFLASRTPGHDLDPDHHRILLTNCFAQGAALMQGRDNEDGARRYAGNRPSATILIDDVNPATLGSLIAFYEQRTFANAMLLGINPFDQFGVELGKDIARSLGDAAPDSFDPSTRQLLASAFGEVE